MIRSICIVLLASGQLAAQPASPTFGLSFAASSFSKGQPVVARLSLTNPGPQSLLVNGRLLVNHPAPSPNEVTLRILNPAGHRLPFLWKVRAGEPLPRHFVELPAGQSLDRQIDLSECYGIREPGIYRIQAVYTNRTSPSGQKAWTGQLLSPLAEVTIR